MAQGESNVTSGKAEGFGTTTPTGYFQMLDIYPILHLGQGHFQWNNF